MVYKWRASDGGRAGVKAQVAGEFMKTIRDSEGKVTPHLVVKHARATQSPIHKLFEWNDKKGAEKWRVVQARDLLGALVVVLPNQVGKESPRAFLAIGDRATPTDYMPLDKVIGDKELRAEALQHALQDFQILRARYNQLTELAKVWKEVNKLAKKYAPKRRRGRAKAA